MWKVCTQEFREFLLVHLAQVVGVGAVQRGDFRIRGGNNDNAIIGHQTRQIFYSRHLNFLWHMLDHFETCNEIERPRRKPDTEVVPLLER